MKTGKKKGHTTPTTFEREMKDPEFRKLFREEEQKLALSELLVTLMDEEKISVRDLAKKADVAVSIVQDMRSGKRDNPTISSLSRILHSVGAELIIRKGKKTLAAV